VFLWSQSYRLQAILPFNGLTSTELRELVTSNNYLADDTFILQLQKLCGKDTVSDMNFEYCTESRFNNLFNCTKKRLDLSVFHLNIRSLNANQRKLVELFCAMDLKFDVIILSEIWSNNI